MEKINGMIFFDIDGTLLDHKGAELCGIKEFYQKYGFNNLIEFDKFNKLWLDISDRNFDKFLKKECSFEEQRANRIIDLFKVFNKDLIYDEALIKFNDYLTIYEESWKAYDDVIPTLEKLKCYRLGIISNGDHNQQVRKLEKMGIKEYFEDIVTAGEVGVAKPNIDIFRIACDRNKVIPEMSYYIGDVVKTDILPCNEIGMKAILINRDEACESPTNINRVFSLKDIKF